MRRFFGRGSDKGTMSVLDGNLIGKMLLRSATLNTPLKVLEWGSGKSTTYFPRMLQNRQIAFCWLSLEHNRPYYTSYLGAKLPPHSVTFIGEDKRDAPAPTRPDESLQLVVFNHGRLYPAKNRADREGTDLSDYVQYPASLNEQFDVIVVDGRYRRACLLEASQMLKPGGFVLLHDALRRHYHCAFTAYRHHSFVGDWLWIGAQDPEPVDAMLEMTNAGFSISALYKVWYRLRHSQPVEA